MFYEATGNYYNDSSKKVMMRVFVAVEISDEDVISSIVKFQSKIKINAKPVLPQNLHFTLQFLGEISEDSVEKIRQALKSIKFSPFKINFKGLGAFPNMKSPRVIWIGIDDFGASILKDLAKKIENLLFPLGFTIDKPFKPHLTVFRIKNKIDNINKELEKFESRDFGFQQISSIKLKQSVLTPQGPVYSDIEEVRAT